MTMAARIVRAPPPKAPSRASRWARSRTRSMQVRSETARARLRRPPPGGRRRHLASELVERDGQADHLADRIVPLGGALLAATLAPLDEHHVLHDRGAPLLVGRRQLDQGHLALLAEGDRKSTRLNSSHSCASR